jgi:hypothetical protein
MSHAIARRPVAHRLRKWLIARCLAPINLDGSQVSDVTIDGQSVSQVTMDGEQVFGGAIPDSAVLYWSGASFADPWPDEVQSEEMSINGLTATTVNGNDAVSGDGTNYGQADVSVLDLSSNFAFEFAIKTTDSSGEIFGEERNGDERFAVGTGNTSISNGTGTGPVIAIYDANQDNQFLLQADTGISDGNLNTVVFNVDLDGGTQNNEILINDTSVSFSISNFPSPTVSEIPQSNSAFFAVDDNGSISDNINADIVGFGFHDQHLDGSTLI